MNPEELAKKVITKLEKLSEEWGNTVGIDSIAIAIMNNNKKIKDMMKLAFEEGAYRGYMAAIEEKINSH